MNAVTLWLQGLQPREQRILLFGGIALVFIVIYFGMWEPMQRNYTQLNGIVIAQHETLAWMQDAAQQVRQLQATTTMPSNPVRSNQSLLSVIDRSMRQKQLNRLSQRIEPKGDDTVRVNFEQVSFNTLLQWLTNLYNQHHVTVTQINLEPQATPGTVKVRLTLFRG